MKTNFYIFGHKSTACEIKETIFDSYHREFNKVFFVVSDHETENICGDCITDSELQKHCMSNSRIQTKFIVSVLDPKIKLLCLKLASSVGMSPFSIISRKAYISPNAKIGVGTYIAPNVAVSCNAVIGNHVVVNYNAVIGHDSIISDFCNISPGACLGGNSYLSERVLIGSNSFIFQGIRIGSDCVVDALTHIYSNVDDRCICSSRNTRIIKRVV
jgi:acetyltransferase-like isoleucine patch superfamily enzyme